MPINKKDKISNVSNSGFSPTFKYGQEQYDKDRFGTDSSAFVLRILRYFEITQSQTLVKQRFPNFDFHCFKLDTGTITTVGHWQ